MKGIVKGGYRDYVGFMCRDIENFRGFGASGFRVVDLGFRVWALRVKIWVGASS